MKLTDIKKFLANAVEMRELLSQTNRIKLSADESQGPLFEKLTTTFDGKLSSKVAKSLASELSRYSRDLKEDELFKNLTIGCKVIAREAAVLEKALDNDTFEAILRDAMNIKQAHIIQFLTLADHYLETTRALAVVIQEAEVYHMRGKELERSSMKYISENFTGENMRALAQLISFFVAKQKEEVVSKIYELPDIKVDETIINTIQSTEGAKKIDPAGFNPLNLINPLAYTFTAQKIWSEIKFYRLEKAEKEMEYLELRHQELVLLRDGRNNPQLESKIDKYQDAIQTLNSKIKKIKDRLG